MKRIFTFIKIYGLRFFIIKLISKLVNVNTIDLAKKIVINKFLNENSCKVKYGLFNGLLLDTKQSWGDKDIISKILGTYEDHIIEYIANFYTNNDCPFIDIGAADGYFVTGVGYKRLTKKIFAFEKLDVVHPNFTKSI